MKLILASVSPRRLELMQQCGIACEVMPVSADESSRPGEEPGETALRLARAKARLAMDRIGGHESWVLAADTVVADGSEALGKPRDAREAEAFLLRLRGREHRVITGVCLLHSPEGAEKTDCAVTAVRMREYSPAELAEYLASGDALDKAGAYAIQHATFRPVASIAGCYTNVVGLPLCRVYALLEGAGEKPDYPLPERCRKGGECGFARLPD